MLQAPALARADGALRLAFTAESERSVLKTLYQKPPCRALFPRVAPDEPLQAVLVTTTGGLTGGDRLTIDVTADAGCTATVTCQAAEKLYRTSPDDTVTEIRTRLTVSDGAWLEWLPQETILFQASRLDRRTTVRLTSGGRLLAAEMLVFGRHAYGEALTAGQLHDGWQIWIDGRLVWRDAVRMSYGTDQALLHAAGLAGARAAATVILAGIADAEHLLPEARGWLESEDGFVAGVTVVNGLLLARCLDPEPARLRAKVADFAGRARHHLRGLKPEVPKVWSI